MLSTVTIPLAGVWLSLNGTDIANNSYVDINDIGRGDNRNGLQCHTNNTDCCNGSTATGSNWYFPDGTRVESPGIDSSYFFRLRGPSVVHLRRRQTTPTERGRFRCQVSNAANISQTIYVNIGE